MMGLDIRPARWRQQAAYWWSAFVLPQTNELPTEQSVRSGRLRSLTRVLLHQARTRDASA